MAVLGESLFTATVAVDVPADSLDRMLQGGKTHGTEDGNEGVGDSRVHGEF